MRQVPRLPRLLRERMAHVVERLLVVRLLRLVPARPHQASGSIRVSGAIPTNGSEPRELLQVAHLTVVRCLLVGPMRRHCLLVLVQLRPQFLEQPLLFQGQALWLHAWALALGAALVLLAQHLQTYGQVEPRG